MEVTIFDKNGKAIAYISADNENAIYLWDGNAVCYLDGEKIYGWKGRHIGWFVNEIIYDTNGLKIGFTKQTCPVITNVEPVKYVKYVKYIKFTPYVKPVFSTSISQQNLREFLQQDRV